MKPVRGAQRRHMTVMFCDLVESTPLAAALDPEDFHEVLTDYRQACQRAIERYDGYTAVYAGDGMTVYFGYPRAHEDDAQRAVHTGLAILHEIDLLSTGLQERFDISLQVRLGVHSGVVIAEEVGGGAGEMPWQLDVSGEMPHVAARLESIAPPGSMVVSDATRELVDGYFDSEPLGVRELKGVSRPMGVHRIVGPADAAERLGIRVRRRLVPLVGRAAEAGRLAVAWDEARAGAGSVVHVTGEAGIGKSRLVHDLVEATRRQSGSSQTWQCSSHHGSTSLHPVTTFLERSLGLSSGAAADEQLEALHRAVADAGLDTAEVVPLLAEVLSVREATLELAPRDARTAALRALESLLVADPARHPLLLVVEDLHWADPTTVELLGRIVRSVEALPVLCVVTFRPGFEPPWAQTERVTRIELGPLTRDEVRALAAAASDAPLDGEVLDWVESTADGVPLFVEEMLKVAHSPRETPVPPTLEGLLTERLDRLPELADAIDLAAVLGREFGRTFLTALDPLGGGDIETALAQLQAHDVLRPVDGAPARWEFAHGLLHEAAYGRILRRRRRTLHAHVAGTLVQDFPWVVEREPEVAARHWSAAGQPGQALPFWRRAGMRALERAAYLEAADHFARGLEALEAAGDADGIEQIEFLTHIGASLQAGSGYAATGVHDAYARAKDACTRLCDDERLAPVIRGQWMFHLLRGEYGTALELADEMLALADSGKAVVPPAEGHLYRGLVHMYLGEFEPARTHLEQALTSYRPPRRRDYVYEAQGDTGVGALAYLALVLWNLGFDDQAREHSDLSLERATSVGGPLTRAQAWGMRGILHLSRSEPLEMAKWVEATYVHSVDNDLGYWRTVSSLLAGWLQARGGQLEQGAQRVRESLDAYSRSGSRLGMPHFHILYADLRRAAGDRQGALDLLEAGAEQIEQTGERFSESELFRFKGRVLAGGDEPDSAAAIVAFERAIAVAREQNARLLELQAAVRLAEHQQKIGEPSGVRERIGELCEWFGPESQLPEVARAQTLLGSESMAR